MSEIPTRFETAVGRFGLHKDTLVAFPPQVGWWVSVDEDHDVMQVDSVCMHTRPSNTRPALTVYLQPDPDEPIPLHWLVDWGWKTDEPAKQQVFDAAVQASRDAQEARG